MPAAADKHVLAVAAVGSELHRRAEVRGVDDVVTTEPVDDEVVGRIKAGDGHRGGQAGHRDHAVVVGDGDHIVAAGGVDDDGIRLAIARAAARRRSQIDRDLVHIGAGQVVDRDGVGAAQGVELDVLDAMKVHGDVADIAEQANPVAIGRDVDVLVDVGAIEQQRVGAGLAFDRVAAVARVPDERVIALAEERHVVAATANHQVIAAAAGQRVVAVTAVQHEIDMAGTERRSVDGVVAAEAVDGQRVVGTLGMGDDHLARRARSR